ASSPVGLALGQNPAVHLEAQRLPPVRLPGGYAAAALGVLLVSFVVFVLRPVAGPVGLLLLYIPVVLGAAVVYGRGPGVAAALLAAAGFDYLDGDPPFTL